MVWWGKLNLVPMNHEQLKKAFVDWVEATGKSSQKTTLYNYFVKYLIETLRYYETTLQKECEAIPVCKPKHRKLSPRRQKRLRTQIWEFMNVGVETVRQFHDFLWWAAEEGEYDFTKRNFNKLFKPKDWRPGGASKRG